MVTLSRTWNEQNEKSINNTSKKPSVGVSGHEAVLCCLALATTVVYWQQNSIIYILEQCGESILVGVTTSCTDHNTLLAHSLSTS